MYPRCVFCFVSCFACCQFDLAPKSSLRQHQVFCCWPSGMSAVSYRARLSNAPATRSVFCRVLTSSLQRVFSWDACWKIARIHRFGLMLWRRRLRCVTDSSSRLPAYLLYVLTLDMILCFVLPAIAVWVGENCHACMGAEQHA